MKKYVVFSLKIANELVKRGFEIVDTGINIDDPRYKVFYFEDTIDFRKAFKEIKG